MAQNAGPEQQGHHQGAAAQEHEDRAGNHKLQDYEDDAADQPVKFHR